MSSETRMFAEFDVPDYVREVSIRFAPGESAPYWAAIYTTGNLTAHIGGHATSAEAAFLGALKTMPRFDFVEAYNAAVNRRVA